MISLFIFFKVLTVLEFSLVFLDLWDEEAMLLIDGWDKIFSYCWYFEKVSIFLDSLILGSKCKVFIAYIRHAGIWQSWTIGNSFQ